MPAGTTMPAPVPIEGMTYTYVLNNLRIDLEWHKDNQQEWRQILEAIKLIPGRRYTSSTKKWSVPNTKEMREWLRASGWNIPEPEVVERPAPPYKPERVLPGLYPYQEDFLKFSLTRPRLALFDEQGCIAGDMVVGVNRHNLGRQMTLARFYEKFHSRNAKRVYTNKERPWFIRCIHDDGVFRLGEVIDVIQSGIKECVRVTFDDGRQLVLTPDHLMKTIDGWIPAEKSLNTEIVCNGTEGCKICGSTKDVITNRRLKFYGYCRKCMYASRNSYKYEGMHEVVRKDGYVYLSGSFLKDYKGGCLLASNEVPKHRYVMEQHLGRPLKSSEIVHHIDGNKQNNDISNLMLLDDQAAHAAFHNASSSAYKHFKFVNPSLHRVVSVEPAGKQMTYDVKVLNHANFLAAGVVVHNCGKTVQALSWMRYHGLLPALFVVTSSTKVQWKGNYERWLGRDDIEVLSGETPKELEPGKSYIINWDILYKWERSPLKHNLYTQGFKALIGDEVQAIGNRTSQRTRAFMRLATRIPCLLAMSGTPARSRPVQLWPVLHCIDPQTFPDFYAYANRYCNPKETPYGTKYEGITNAPELHSLLSTRTLRRTKAEVMSFLPPKIITTVPCSVDKGKMEAYKEQAKKAREATEFERSAAIAGLFQSAYDLKADACKQWIMDFLSTDEKLLVFAWHHAVVNDIANFLASKEIGVRILTGETSSAQRECIKTEFVNDEKVRVIVANIQSAGVGIDGLQKACSNCCFVEFTAAPTDHWQAEDRLHRGGQEVPVNVYYLVAPRTIDVTMAYQLDTKAVALASVLDGTDSGIVKISDMLKKKKG